MKCTICGKRRISAEHPCPHCGAPPESELDQEPNRPARSRLVYILLAFFGLLGLHNFYARRNLTAVVQLLLFVCSCGFLSFFLLAWAFFEMLLVTHDGDGMPMQNDAGPLLAVLSGFLLALLAGFLILILFVLMWMGIHLGSF